MHKCVHGELYANAVSISTWTACIPAWVGKLNVWTGSLFHHKKCDWAASLIASTPANVINILLGYWAERAKGALLQVVPHPDAFGPGSHRIWVRLQFCFQQSRRSNRGFKPDNTTNDVVRWIICECFYNPSGHSVDLVDVPYKLQLPGSSAHLVWGYSSKWDNSFPRSYPIILYLCVGSDWNRTYREGCISLDD